MTFYLNPPSGNISLQTLEKFARSRLEFLLKIASCAGDKLKLQDVVTDLLTVSGSECLMDGSNKDLVSHFILRLILCQEHDTRDFLLKAEQQLFRFRFQCMSEEELSKSLRRTDSNLKKVQQNCYSTPLQNLEKLVHVGKVFRMITDAEPRWRLIVQHYLAGEDKRGFWVPFFVVPRLVSQRKVIMEEGLAFVPFCKLEDVILELWQEILAWGVEQARRVQRTFLQDRRILRLTRHIQAIFRQQYGSFEKSTQDAAYLSHDHISETVTLFPPCMSHVHRILATTHRLRHHSRIQYTLFLKEIGMPVHEALMFWRKEYSISGKNKDGCTHGWEHDGKRYTYNIRHLYGLEGSHTNYRGHCCLSLQRSALGVGEQGGCPFNRFDLDHLEDLLQTEGIHQSREVIKRLSMDGRYSEACRRTLDEKRKTLKRKNENSGKSDNFTNIVQIISRNNVSVHDHLLTEKHISDPSDPVTFDPCVPVTLDLGDKVFPEKRGGSTPVMTDENSIHGNGVKRSMSWVKTEQEHQNTTYCCHGNHLQDCCHGTGVLNRSISDTDTQCSAETGKSCNGCHDNGDIYDDFEKMESKMVDVDGTVLDCVIGNRGHFIQRTCGSGTDNMSCQSPTLSSLKDHEIQSMNVAVSESREDTETLTSGAHDHRTSCTPQTDPVNVQINKIPESGHDIFLKPSDYYFSLKKLVDGLQNYEIKK